MPSQRRWEVALIEHRRATEDFLTGVARCPEEAWQHEPEPGSWSPAALTLHVTGAYELGCRALAGGPGMRLRVRPWRAWVLRQTLLPRLLRHKQFPKVRAPREVQPDLEAAKGLTRPAAAERLQQASTAAAAAFHAADGVRNIPRMTHAYFGPLSPLVALRFLTAHTTHHTVGLQQLIDRIGWR